MAPPSAGSAAAVELIGEVGGLRGWCGRSFSFHLERAGRHSPAAALDGGALMDVGCYCVSAARLLAGEPLEVAAAAGASAASGVDVRFDRD